MKKQLFGKRMDIYRVKFDTNVKVDSIQLNDKDLKSEVELIDALQNRMRGMDNGRYSVQSDTLLFARFSMIDNVISGLDKWSENTGIIMPCWSYFES